MATHFFSILHAKLLMFQGYKIKLYNILICIVKLVVPNYALKLTITDRKQYYSHNNMAENILQDAHQWETSKENVKPIKSGRKVKGLQLQSNPTTVHTLLEEEK